MDITQLHKIVLVILCLNVEKIKFMCMFLMTTINMVLRSSMMKGFKIVN